MKNCALCGILILHIEPSRIVYVGGLSKPQQRRIHRECAASFYAHQRNV